ncbi:unnamed protein product [Moneuplotes crassus]|uniref:FAR-17a/AIG1-like protein n=1 Tax=Euplotes crassus TaxID=5936 RepID=A0AAD1XWK7_EUPCR|nr:unnamed protein product [Moneuplotes crassus]
MAKQKESISLNQLHNFHNSRMGGDFIVLVLRIVFLLIPMVYTEYVTISTTELKRRFYFFTLFSMTKVDVFTFLAITISLMKVFKINVPRKLLRVHQILFETTFVSQVIVFIIYWVAIHHTMDDLIAEQGQEFVKYLYVSHIIPFLCISAELFISKPVVLQSELIYMIYYGSIYTVSNFIQTKLTNVRPYPFMTWEDYTSVIAFFVILLFMIVIYTVSSQITHIVNGVKQKQE